MTAGFRPALMASVSMICLCAEGVFAQEAPRATGSALDEITVTATRREEKAVDALASVSVVGREQIRTQAPQRIGTIISRMPGVTTQENPNDPATAINIRGLQDFGRVAVTVDGARQNFQRSGHNANGAFFLDPAFLRSIDITRGPVANIYGSGAIGGVVSFETVDPRDILRPGEKIAGEAGFTTAAGGRQSGVFGHGIAALRPTDWASGLVGLSFRNLNPFKDGGGFTIPDSGQELYSGIGKIVLTPGDGHTLKLSGQYQNYDYTNGLGTATAPRRRNEVETSNFVARYSFSRPDNDWLNLNVSAYRTTTDNDQIRVSGTPAQIGQQRFFKIATNGFDINNTTRFAAGPVKFAVTYGLDGFQDEVKTWDPFSNGAATTPRGKRTVIGGFVQNHASWSIIDVIAGLRYDSYSLSGTAASNDGQRLSPKITIGITPFKGLQPYITYAEGYRAPAITETLVNGLHPGSPFSAFTFVPNPNLRPETGRTFELGVNLKYDSLFREGDAFRGKIAVFENQVRDYIEGRLTDPGNDCGIAINGCADATYGYSNISRARLRGVEGEFTYDARRWFATLAGSMVRGDNLATGMPLESVFPDKVVIGGGLRFLNEKLVVGGRVTLVAKQNRLPSTAAAATYSKSYGLVDADIAYEIAKDTRFFAIAENIGDVRYKRFRDGDRSPGFVTKVGFTTRLGN